MIPKLEKTFVSIVTSFFVFLVFILEAFSSYKSNYSELGLTATTPFATVFFVTLGSWYYHNREDFDDHFRLILSCAGFPAFLVGLQGLSRAI